MKARDLAVTVSDGGDFSFGGSGLGLSQFWGMRMDEREVYAIRDCCSVGR